MPDLARTWARWSTLAAVTAIGVARSAEAFAFDCSHDVTLARVIDASTWVVQVEVAEYEFRDLVFPWLDEPVKELVGVFRPIRIFKGPSKPFTIEWVVSSVLQVEAPIGSEVVLFANDHSIPPPPLGGVSIRDVACPTMGVMVRTQDHPGEWVAAYGGGTVLTLPPDGDYTSTSMSWDMRMRNGISLDGMPPYAPGMPWEKVMEALARTVETVTKNPPAVKLKDL